MSENKSTLDSTNVPSNAVFWENKYQMQSTGWDLGCVSPPLKSYIDTIQNKDVSILIPGCGNAYEAEYLLKQGFRNITLIDFAPTLVQHLQDKFANYKNINVVLGNFFEHSETYDLILEQTFFCALPTKMRQRYVWKMHQLLAEDGIIAGLLFNRDFENGPPFGGNKFEYEKLFQKSFIFNSLHTAQNSIPNRANTELFFEFQKNNSMAVNLYNFEIFDNYKNATSAKLLTLDGVENVSMNNECPEILISSKKELDLDILQKLFNTTVITKIQKT